MMFNFFLRCFPGKRQAASKCGGIRSGGRSTILTVTGLGLLALLVGCQTAPPLPPADLQAPGWEIRQGQALWKPRRDEEGIAGEILIALQKDNRKLVQFSKTPFPLITAGVGPHSWELEIPTQGKHYSHRGTPPSRVVWFQLLRALAVEDLPNSWAWTSPDADGRWRLENKTSGESLEGYFIQ
jgi:hypothetical protein